MEHNAMQAIRAAEKVLSDKKVKYVNIDPPMFKENIFEQGMSERTDVWVVPYVYIVFQDESAFIYFKDVDLSLIHILTGHGYIMP
ncbi:methionine synthase II (cobalamin-independent) [Mucilaginibacter sp. UYNi724]